VRLRLEQLENRTLMSNYSAATLSDLIADINAANAAGGSNTITLAKQTYFALTQVNNTSDGSPTGLPVIATGDNLTIVGNNDTIERSYASGTPQFRLFDVASGALLTLENLTVQNGDVFDLPFPNQGYGGAIYSNGGLTVSGVTMIGNRANSGSGVYIAGGTANLSNDMFSYNFCNTGAEGGGAIAVAGGTANFSRDTLEGNRAGGSWNMANAIYVGGGTVTLSNDLVEDNVGSPAILINGGTVTFCSDTVKENYSDGGIYIAAGSVTIDQYTVDHTLKNVFDITGPYTLQNC
jgi:hypothetical protein